MEKLSGGATEVLKCSYSTITPEELILKVIPEYKIGPALECRFWQRGASDTYQIRCSDMNYFLRVSRHNAYSLEAYEFEAELLNYLHQNGFPVAYPVSKKSGGFITEVRAPEGKRHVILTKLAEGDVPDYRLKENCHLVGKSIAQMHNLSDGFKTTKKRRKLDLQGALETPMSLIRAHIKHLPEKIELIEEVAKEVRKAITLVAEHNFDIGICHGDLHGGNLHLHRGQIRHFDFEDCANGYRLYDLGTFKWGVCTGSNGAERWEAFLEGYKSARPISEVSLSLINQFVRIREIEETAYGIRHIQYYGYNDIRAAEIDYVCQQLQKDYS